MRQIIIICIFMMAAVRIAAQDHNMPQPCDSLQPDLENDEVSAPERIPFLLDAQIFIPYDRLAGLVPWHYAPMTRPIVLVIPRTGISGTVGFGEFSQEHPEKFFSTLEGYNSINIPQLYLTQQMMIGNTLRLARNFYMLSGILYGAQLGVMGNNWGMGTREGFLWHPSAMTSIMLWNQYFQSVSVYAPVVIPVHAGSGTAIKMPATPEVFSFGLQASFVVGEFIICIGTSVTPKPFDPKQSRYK
jgi:hypothetical protein